MAYCDKCGMHISDEATVCAYCGANIVKPEPVNFDVPESTSTPIILGVLGIIFAFLIPLVTWILSGIGLKKAKDEFNNTGIVLNWIALILSFISVAINVYLVMNTL